MDKKYWEDLNRFPPLSREDEKETAIKAKNGDRLAYEKLINSNLRFVVSVAKDYSNQGLLLEDLIAYGNLGICKAFAKYDPERGNKFITYAVWWIRQAILQALTEHNHLIKVPHYQRVTKSLIEKTKEELERTHQRSVGIDEVEQEIGKTVKVETLQAYHVVSLDKSFTEDGDAPLSNAIMNTEETDPDAESDHRSFLTELDDVLKDFTEREKTIIKYYHGIGTVRNLTLEEIGTEFGITRERVRQIKEKVLERLRHKSRSGKLQPYLAVLKSEIMRDLSHKDENPN